MYFGQPTDCFAFFRIDTLAQTTKHDKNRRLPGRGTYQALIRSHLDPRNESHESIRCFMMFHNFSDFLPLPDVASQDAQILCIGLNF